jgi:hypothetical protein
MNDPLEAAVGFLELGMWREANDEIERLPPERKFATEVLKVRLRIYKAAGAGELGEVVRQELARRGVEMD